MRVTNVVFACHSAACAPPPVGTGGSTGGGLKRPKASFDLPSDTHEILSKMNEAQIHPATIGYTRAKHGGDIGLAVVYEERGYNAKPQRVSTEEFSKMVQEEPDRQRMWRGIGEADFRRELHESDTHWVGMGVFGNGTYFAGTTSTATGNDALTEAGGYGNIMTRAMLAKDAKIVNYKEIAPAIQAAMALRQNTKEELETLSTEELRDRAGGFRLGYVKDEDDDLPHWEAGRKLILAEKNANAYKGTQDAGRVAAILGYDAIRSPIVQGPGKSVDYMVILNRGKLILDDENYRGVRGVSHEAELVQNPMPKGRPIVHG